MDQLGENIRNTLSRQGERAKNMFSRDGKSRTAVMTLDADYNVKEMNNNPHSAMQNWPYNAFANRSNDLADFSTNKPKIDAIENSEETAGEKVYLDKSQEEIYIEKTYEQNKQNYDFRGKFYPIDDQKFEKSAKMYSKLQRYYQKNGMKSFKTNSKIENGKNKSKVTRIVKQIDQDVELRDLIEEEVFEDCGKLKIPSKDGMPDSMMSNYTEVMDQRKVELERKKKMQQDEWVSDVSDIDDEAKIKQLEEKLAKKKKSGKEICYEDLMLHINAMHPRRSGQEFSVFDQEGSNACFICCGNSKSIPSLTKEIGVGSAMFLMSTKAMSVLFFILMLLNIPVYVFYYQSNPMQAHNPKIQDYFSSLSLGNIGSTQQACDSINLAIDNEVTLHCPTGKLEKMLLQGIGKDDSASCTSVRSTADYNLGSRFFRNCFTDYRNQSATDKLYGSLNKKFEDHFNEICVGEQTCIINLNKTSFYKPKILNHTLDTNNTSDNDDSQKQGDNSNLNDTKDSGFNYQDPKSCIGSCNEIPKVNTGGSDPLDFGDGGGLIDIKAETTGGSRRRLNYTNKYFDPATAGKIPSKSGTDIWFAGVGKQKISTFESNELQGFKPQCKLELEYRLYYSKYISKDETKKLKLQPQNSLGRFFKSPYEPWVIFLAQCRQDDIIVQVPWEVGTRRITKQDFGIMIVLVDFVIVIILICYSQILESRQVEFAQNFSAQTIQMKDFALEFFNLPPEKNTLVLKAIVWDHLMQVMNDQHMEEKDRPLGMGEPKYSIVDITFSTKDTKELVNLNQMSKLRVKIEKLKDRIEVTQLLVKNNAQNIKKIKKQTERLRFFQKKYKKESKSFLDNHLDQNYNLQDDNEHLSAFVVFQSTDAKALMVNAFNHSIKYRLMIWFFQCICIRKRYQMKLRHWPVYEIREEIKPEKKFQQSLNMQDKQNFNEGQKVNDIKNEGKKLNESLKSKDNQQPEKQDELQEEKLRVVKFWNGKWPSPVTPSEPDNIKWENIGQSKYFGALKRFTSWIFAIIIIFLAFSGIIYFNQLQKFSKENEFVNVDMKRCKPLIKNADLANAILEKFRAYYDQTTVQKDEREGLMNCYCYEKLKEDPFGNTIKDMTFKSFNVTDDHKWCNEWWQFFKVQATLKYLGPMVVILINLIVPITFQLLTAWEKHVSRNNETESLFVKITILQYFNLAIVFILINFKIPITFLNDLRIFDGTYEDFTPRWYQQLGAGLCFTLFINVFSPQASKIGIPVISLLMRWRDRGLKMDIKGEFELIDSHENDRTQVKAENSGRDSDSIENEALDLEDQNEGGEGIQRTSTLVKKPKKIDFKSIKKVPETPAILYRKSTSFQKNIKVRTKQLIQQDLKNLYTGKEIQAFMVYAQQFVSFWAIMTHSSGMPFLYVIGFINYFVTYWIYKVLLVKHYSKTMAFNEDLPLLSINYIRIGIFFHLFEGAIVFSNSKIISDEQIAYLSQFKDKFDNSINTVNENFSLNYFSRFTKGIGFMYFIFTVTIIFFLLIKTVFYGLFKAIFYIVWNFLTCGGQKGLKTQEYERQINIDILKGIGADSESNNIISDFGISNLEKFYNRIIREFDDYCEMFFVDIKNYDMHDQKQRALFDKRHKDRMERYPQIDYECKKLVRRFMENRIKQVERVICDHITLLMKISQPEDPNNPEFKFIYGLSSQKKIDILKHNVIIFQKYIQQIMTKIEKDPDTKAKQKIFRLKGMNQSYNMLESHLFREQNHTMQQLLRKKEKIEKKKKKEIWENTVEELDNKSIIKIREKAISRHVSFQSATHDIEMNGQEALNNIASNSTSLRNIVHHTLSSQESQKIVFIKELPNRNSKFNAIKREGKPDYKPGDSSDDDLNEQEELKNMQKLDWRDKLREWKDSILMYLEDAIDL